MDLILQLGVGFNYLYR